MWSLPNIKAMNAQAAAQASKIRRAARRGPGKRQTCEYRGCQERAVESAPWFDIFSEDPKGLVHVCAGHNPWDVEGFFLCDECQRVICDHITWERYQVELNDRVLCLACAAEEHFQDPTNWIDPRQVREVGLSDNGAPLFSRETGFLNLARCRHVLGVEQPLPAGIKFADNAEFDSMDGHQISGERLLDVIAALDGQEFCPVLDAAYQFAVSIGFYVRDGQHHAEAQREAA
jgi:hypothetical protein